MLFEILPFVESLKWPFVVLASLIGLCVLFKREVSHFLARLDSVSRDGLKATPLTGPQKQVAQDASPDRKQVVQELSQALDSQAIREREAFIRDELKKRHLETSGDTVDILVRYLARTSLALQFEQIYRVIFGSQIYLLKTAHTNRGFNEQDLQKHFAHVKGLFAPSLDDWDEERYITYILNSGLLLKSGNHYSITALGLDFLSYVLRSGYSETPPL